MKSEIKKLKSKTVKLTYRVNGYVHEQHGEIIKVGSESFLFQPFELDAMPLTYAQVIEVELIKI